MRLLSALLLALLAAAAPERAPQVQATILLVRHADRASQAADSPLSAAGERRAECLAATLRDAGVGAIFATDLVRTQQTAAPLARILHRGVTVVPKAATDELVRHLRAGAAGVVLVVGHSDTIPELVERLGAGPVAPFGGDEYDRLIIVRLDGAPAATTAAAASPAAASNARQAAPALVLHYGCGSVERAPGR